VIFRISKHLGWLPSEVIAQKYTPDIQFLRRKYYMELVYEAAKAKAKEKAAKELEEERQKVKV